jgi:hypothetical protein
MKTRTVKDLLGGISPEHFGAVVARRLALYKLETGQDMKSIAKEWWFFSLSNSLRNELTEGFNLHVGNVPDDEIVKIYFKAHNIPFPGILSKWKDRSCRKAGKVVLWNSKKYRFA